MNYLNKFLKVLSEPVDGILLTKRENRRYAAGFDIAEGMALITKKVCYYYTDSRYLEAAQTNLEGFEVHQVTASDTYCNHISRAVTSLGLKTLAFEENDWTVGTYTRFQEQLPVTWMPFQKVIEGFREQKEEAEIAIMRKAQAITDAAFSQVISVIHPGMTEKELMAQLISCLYQNGADGLSFAPIVVSGPNTSLPHGVPGDRKLQAGDFVTMDFGCIVDGYCSDMTRTVALEYATEEMERVYYTVLKAQKAAIAQSRAGMTGQQIDAIARNIIKEAGYGEYFGHSYGHSLGLEIHENPNCSPSNKVPIPVGAVCSAEPGIYLPGKYGVRIEDVVIFRENNVENITKSPKELCILSS